MVLCNHSSSVLWTEYMAVWSCVMGSFQIVPSSQKRLHNVANIFNRVVWKTWQKDKTHMTLTLNIQIYIERVSVCNNTTVTIRVVGSLVSCAYDHMSRERAWRHQSLDVCNLCHHRSYPGYLIKCLSLQKICYMHTMTVRVVETSWEFKMWRRQRGAVT